MTTSEESSPTMWQITRTPTSPNNFNNRSRTTSMTTISWETKLLGSRGKWIMFLRIMVAGLTKWRMRLIDLTMHLRIKIDSFNSKRPTKRTSGLKFMELRKTPSISLREKLECWPARTRDSRRSLHKNRILWPLMDWAALLVVKVLLQQLTTLRPLKGWRRESWNARPFGTPWKTCASQTKANTCSTPVHLCKSSPREPLTLKLVGS